MKIMNIAGYKFISLPDTERLQAFFLNEAKLCSLKGTILLSHEGININLSGRKDLLETFLTSLKKDLRFADISFHQTFSNNFIFKRLKVKLKTEIITMKNPSAQPKETLRAPTISPNKLKEWLDTEKSFTLLDTRNTYEIKFGTFQKATHLNINDFSTLPENIEKIPHTQPIVMFCTGGIRCEKAALFMLNQGYTDVYQLEGGILGYFKETDGTHYEGECFVFDDRISVNTKLAETDTRQCTDCQGPIFSNDAHHCSA